MFATYILHEDKKNSWSELLRNPRSNMKLTLWIWKGMSSINKYYQCTIIIAQKYFPLVSETSSIFIWIITAPLLSPLFFWPVESMSHFTIWPRRKGDVWLNKAEYYLRNDGPAVENISFSVSSSTLSLSPKQN